MRHISEWLITLALVFSALLPAQAQLMGGGPLPGCQGDCISPQERARAEANIALYHALHGGAGLSIQSLPQPYPFFPQAGNLFDDLFVNNYTDLDPSPGIRDFDGTDWTYDGHQGHDVDLRTFGEQDIGVPIFAALEGTVVDAHDGEFDRNTSWNNQTANYVILWHGGTHYTYYWHMKQWSVAVGVGQQVTRGTQLGLTASSGISTGPHLHFESHVDGSWFEPNAGASRPGPSNWIDQVPIRRETYFRDFNLTNVDISQYPGLPYDMPRTGTFMTGWQSINWWINLMNYTSNSTWHVRFLRPDGSVMFDSGVVNFGYEGNYRWTWWSWSWVFYFDMIGTWHAEMRINEELTASAPFEIVDNLDAVSNRPPNPLPFPEFDPPVPTASDALFCRIHPDLFDDPDYDLVSYLYFWYVNGELVRATQSAANSDALPAGLMQHGDFITCTVVPYDGLNLGEAMTPFTFCWGTERSSLSGTLALESVFDSRQPITFVFNADFFPPFQRTVTLAPDGSYVVPGLPPREYYEVKIKGRKWLQSKQGVDLSHGDNVLSAFLRAGDADDNNIVDIGDLALLIETFDADPTSPNWNGGVADFNCDDLVAVDDLDLLIRNFDAEGD